MPRGNDSIDAARELAERYKTTGNAEHLIAAQRARRSTTLRKASLLPADPDAKLDLAKVKKDAGVDGEIITAAKRGDYIVYVERLENGRTRKNAYPIEGDAPVEVPDGRAVEAAAANAATAAYAEAEQEAEKVRQKAAAEARKAADDARKSATKSAEKAEKEAEKQEKKGSSS